MIQTILNVIKELTIYIFIKAAVLYVLWNYILVWQLNLPSLTFAATIAIATIVSILFYSRMRALTLDQLNNMFEVQVLAYKKACYEEVMRQMAEEISSSCDGCENCDECDDTTTQQG